MCVYMYAHKLSTITLHRSLLELL